MRYYGWYSNRSRGMRKQLEESDNTDINIIDEPADPAFARAAKASWTRLIQKVSALTPVSLYLLHPCSRTKLIPCFVPIVARRCA